MTQLIDFQYALCDGTKKWWSQVWEHTDEVRFNRSEPIEYRKQFRFLQTNFVRKFRIKQMRHLRKAFHALRV